MKIAMQRLLRGEKNMMYYPEGSRNRLSGAPKNLGDIKTPIMKFAFDNGITIYPVSMCGTNRMVKNFVIQYGTPLGIIFHEGLNPQDFESKDEFIAAAWSKVQSGHEELVEKLAKL